MTESELQSIHNVIDAAICQRFEKYEQVFSDLTKQLTLLNAKIVNSIGAWIAESTSAADGLQNLSTVAAQIKIQINDLVAMQSLLTDVVQSVDKIYSTSQYASTLSEVTQNLLGMIKNMTSVSTAANAVAAVADVVQAINSGKTQVQL